MADEVVVVKPKAGERVLFIDHGKKINALVKAASDGVHPGLRSSGVHLNLLYVDEGGNPHTMIAVPHVSQERQIGWVDDPLPQMQRALDQYEKALQVMPALRTSEEHASQLAETLIKQTGELDAKVTSLETELKTAQETNTILNERLARMAPMVHLGGQPGSDEPEGGIYPQGVGPAYGMGLTSVLASTTDSSDVDVVAELQKAANGAPTPEAEKPAAEQAGE